MGTLSALVAAPFCRFEKTGSPDLDGDETVLGLIEHGTGHTDVSLVDGVLRTAVHTTTREDEAFTEVWHARRPVESGTDDGIAWARTDEYLFGVVRTAESGRYADATASLYTRIFELTRSLGHPLLARTWNYVSGINRANADGLEVYQDFCVGRARALDAAGVDPATMPAATGIGAHGGGITCVFLAARGGDRINIENPGVLTAHHYPAEYGPRPPVFARATQLGPPDGGRLFVSATAGILGHETVRLGDVTGQCEVALDNIARVVGAENLRRHGVAGGHTLADVDHLKVYIRHREHFEAVRRVCAARLSNTADIAFLHTDIARENLLVEIEGMVS